MILKLCYINPSTVRAQEQTLASQTESYVSDWNNFFLLQQLTGVESDNTGPSQQIE